ncbi:unnamed protein product [Allacma fusca]|uniref:DUF5641 domain-containing protein n=1 Tax=Allacma fusca TaxID=39272 RepID=A0A8J2LBB6_9HEXA|nr:unnamed protein product [Allacma fusca]
MQIFSDNGTNFHGANNELKKALSELDPNAIEAKMISKGISWNFIPISSPYMGGVWDRLVRSVKTAFGATLKTPQKPEVVATLMTEVECIINSRPLTHVRFYHNDDEALTPNHFLIGSSSGYQPLGDFEKRWLKEYLPSLTRRTKWLGPVKPLEVDVIVIIADERMPRNLWPKGIVVKKILAKDGQCRVADIRTKIGFFPRPVSKICVLDVRPECSHEA